MLNISNKFERVLYLFQKMPILDATAPYLALNQKPAKFYKAVDSTQRQKDASQWKIDDQGLLMKTKTSSISTEPSAFLAKNFLKAFRTYQTYRF